MDNLRRGMAQAFFDKYYVPANINIAIVGDVDPAQARRLAERYFGPMPARPLPPLIHTVEPAQDGPKTAIVESRNQPLFATGYKRPGQYDKDDPVYEVISLILSSGRTGLLYKELVQEKKIALDGGGRAGLPVVALSEPVRHLRRARGGAHRGRKPEGAGGRAGTACGRRKSTPQTLQRVKTKARAAVIRRLDSNAGLASSLAAEYGSYGDWRKLFTQLDDLNKVTAEDVERVARSCFVAQNRTVAFTVPPHELRAAAGAGEGRP